MEHKQIPKDILTDGEKYHCTQTIKMFLVSACADIQFLNNGDNGNNDKMGKHGLNK